MLIWGFIEDEDYILVIMDSPASCECFVSTSALKWRKWKYRWRVYSFKMEKKYIFSCILYFIYLDQVLGKKNQGWSKKSDLFISYFSQCKTPLDSEALLMSFLCLLLLAWMTEASTGPILPHFVLFHWGRVLMILPSDLIFQQEEDRKEGSKKKADRSKRWILSTCSWGGSHLLVWFSRPAFPHLLLLAFCYSRLT